MVAPHIQYFIFYGYNLRPCHIMGCPCHIHPESRNHRGAVLFANVSDAIIFSLQLPLVLTSVWRNQGSYLFIAAPISFYFLLDSAIAFNQNIS